MDAAAWKAWHMAVSHPPSEALPGRSQWLRQMAMHDMWPSLAIAVIWLAVLVDALWGPDFVSTTAGGDTTRIPSAIVVAFFAWLATRAIAKYGFARDRAT
jgi:hypothetical protein